MEKHRLFCHFYKHGTIFWFRIKGYGLCFRNTNEYPRLFSERRGYTKGLLIRHIYIKTLIPY